MSYIRTQAFHGPQQEFHANDQPLILDGLGAIVGIPDVGGTVEIGSLGDPISAAAGAASTAQNIASLTSAVANLATAGSGVYFGAKDRKEARKDKAKEEDQANAAAAQSTAVDKTASSARSPLPKWVIPAAAIGGAIVLLSVLALLTRRAPAPAAPPPG